MSKIIDILLHEHEEISKFIKKLRSMCLDFMKEDKIDISEFRAGINFIKTYADERHHQKEEELLFKAMVENIGIKAENLIKYGMLIEHDSARYYVSSLEKAVDAYEKEKNDENKLDILCYALAYCDLLSRHVYKENNVVYPFGERLLSKEIMDKLDIGVEEYEKRFE
ncbi:MAG: hemerythrin domain-containing protein [Mucispirillum sp.]|uniref:Hemerythrin domain-containing protein n=1 Tax=Candidatus Mucispirillum faecigallinarum TaxID=2838699 RepID=A0A9D2GUM9_9BACT|nr:hemerythrin domain-containing protein [Mucispirillum sp.]HIZ90328.1 hemerythrin domain-containing protein [Candidatus Mucispirillum faecigallinarum]